MANDLENSIKGTNTLRKGRITQNVYNTNGKLPPQALDLEEAVLGALMIEKDALTAVADILKPDIFYTDAHKKIYEAISSLFGSNSAIDILTVTNELRRLGTLEIVGGAYYITDLTSRVASAANIEFHARIIAQKYIQRELIRISTDIVTRAYEDTTDIFDLLDYAETHLFEVAQSNLRRDIRNIKDVVAESLEKMELAKNKKDGLTGVASGFSGLDAVTGGWQKSDLIIVGARPAMGKTAFALSMARNAAVDFNIPVAVFSLEMASFQLVNRLISAESEINTSNIAKGRIADAEWEQIHKSIGALTEAPIYIDDTPSLNVFEFRAKARRLKQQYNIQMIVIDYLQLMKGSSSDGKIGNREQEIAGISRALKAVAKELDIPVVALAQLNRMVVGRADMRPLLSDLRDSGSIEQDADMVLLLHRPEYYKLEVDENGNSTKGMAEVIIAKFRNGETKTVPLRFIGEFVKYADPEVNFGKSSYSPTPLMGNTAEFDSQNALPTRSITLGSKANDDPMAENEELPF